LATLSCSILAAGTTSECRASKHTADNENGSGQQVRRDRRENDTYEDDDNNEVVQLSTGSKCGSPSFGSRTELSSIAEALAKFGGGVRRYRGPGVLGGG
jgi:hypothetical protein